LVFIFEIAKMHFKFRIVCLVDFTHYVVVYK